MPGKPSSKRKNTSDDPIILPHPQKKPKTDAADNGRLNPRKKPLSEVRGGLVILRAPSRSSIAPPDHLAASTSKRPAPDHASSFATPSRRVKPRVDSKTSSSSDAQVADDVRAMDEEADYLRRNSLRHVPEASSLDTNSWSLEFPAHSRSTSARQRDKSLPIHNAESPQIARNRKMRDAAMAKYQNQDDSSAPNTIAGASSTPSVSPGHHRRRSSVSSRGKRISSSYEATGIISQPHSSVKNEFLHKHIDHELPAAAQLRQLLVWSWPRAQGISVTADPAHPSGASNLTNKTRNLQISSPSAGLALKTAKASILKMIADKTITTSPSSLDLGKQGVPLKPNPRNTENRAWKVAWSVCLNKLKSESQNWKDMASDYVDLSKRLARDRHSSLVPNQLLSAKSRGKQRAHTMEAVGSIPLTPTRQEDQHGLSLARGVASSTAPSSALTSTTTGAFARDSPSNLLWRIGSIYSLVHSAGQIAHTMEMELDQNYTVVANSLRARYQDGSGTILPGDGGNRTSQKGDDTFIGWIVSQYLPHLLGAGPGQVPTFGLASLIPGGLAMKITEGSNSDGCGPSKLDPQDLLRALTSIDSARSPDQVSDAARKAAREVQRVEGNGTTLGSERRLTLTGYSSFGSSGGNGMNSGMLQGGMTPKKMLAVSKHNSTPGHEPFGTPRAKTPAF